MQHFSQIVRRVCTLVLFIMVMVHPVENSVERVVLLYLLLIVVYIISPIDCCKNSIEGYVPLKPVERVVYYIYLLLIVLLQEWYS